MKQTKERVAEIQVSYRPAISNKPVIISALDAFVEMVEFFPVGSIALEEKSVVMYLARCNRVLGVYPLSMAGVIDKGRHKTDIICSFKSGCNRNHFSP